MNGTSRTVVAGRAPGRTGSAPGLRGLAVSGGVATLTAMAVTTLAAAGARAVGVDFAVSGSAETIPLAGVAVVTGFFSAVGVLIAAGLLRWSTRPADRFVRTTVTLTAVSMVAPLLWGADTATIAALMVLHLVAASVMIPALSRSLRKSHAC